MVSPDNDSLLHRKGLRHAGKTCHSHRRGTASRGGGAGPAAPSPRYLARVSFQTSGAMLLPATIHRAWP